MGVCWKVAWWRFLHADRDPVFFDFVQEIKVYLCTNFAVLAVCTTFSLLVLCARFNSKLCTIVLIIVRWALTIVSFYVFLESVAVVAK